MHTKLFSRRSLLLSGSVLVPMAFAQRLTGQEFNAPGPAAHMMTDPMLAMQLLMMGRKQIALCELALPTLSDQAAKKFATTEIEEHEHLKSKLSKLGFEYKAASDVKSSDIAERQVAATQFLVDGRPLSAADSVPLILMHQVIRQGIDTQKTEMMRLSGQDFDHRFIESQLDAHYDLLDHDTVFREYASMNLNPVFHNTRDTIEKHISICKELRKALAAAK